MYVHISSWFDRDSDFLVFFGSDYQILLSLKHCKDTFKCGQRACCSIPRKAFTCGEPTRARHEQPTVQKSIRTHPSLPLGFLSVCFSLSVMCVRGCVFLFPESGCVEFGPARSLEPAWLCVVMRSWVCA